jgi:hypothetical protein
MTLEQFLNLVVIIFGAVGSIYVLRSILNLTPQVTERMSAPIFGHNLEIINSLSTQKADGFVGTCLILIALITALINTATTPSSIVVHSSRIFGILFSIVLSAIAYALLLLVGSRVYSRHRRATIRIIASKKLDKLFKNRIVPLYEIESLRNLYENFLNNKIPPDLSNKDFLQLIAKDVSCIMPIGIQVEGESSNK